MATTINAGRVRFVSRGTYNNSTQYYLFDLVDYNGSSYIAKENTLGNLPTNTEYWQLIAEKGNTGSTGQTGPTGATGNGISSITKTGTSGLVDTYTITYTNGNTTTFTVTNGEDGEVTETELNELRQQVEDLEDNQRTNTASGTEIYISDSAKAKNRSIGLTGRSTQNGEPTPENPVEIKSCGDNGSVNEKISNIKNFLDWNKFIDFSSWTNALSSGYMRFKIDGLKANTKYTLCRVDDSGYNILPAMYAGFNSVNNNTNRFIDYATQSSNLKSITAISNNDGILYVVFAMSNATRLQQYINLIQDCWVIEGESFVEKEEQTLSFPLAQGQKLMQGDYLADDGVHHVRKQTIESGTTITLSDAKTNGAYLCNKKVAGNLSGQTLTFDEAVTDAIIEYELATEVIDSYTSEQQTAWEQIKKARTYKGGTIISSEDETPATVDIEYVVDVNTIYDRVTALENRINS